MKFSWMKGLTALGLGLVATAGLAHAQVPGNAPGANQVPGNAPAGNQVPGANVGQPRQPGQAAQPGRTGRPGQPGRAAQFGQDRGQGIDVERRPGDLPGPIDSLHDLQDSARMAFMMADQDHDGLISQQEATDAANVLVGGFFFAADANGDGVLSREEAEAARDRIMQQNPLLRFVLQRAQNAQQGNDNQGNATQAVRDVLNEIDTNNDRQLQASEVRQAVATAVQGLFAVADTNRDNQLSPNELNAAVYGLARAAVQASFQAADRDNNGALSQEEFAQAIVEPANTVFAILDANQDGQLTPEELRRAGRVVANQLQMFTIPEADNSIQNLLESGRRPGEVAPVPDINVNNPNPAAGRAPATPDRTTPPGRQP